jgi:hypothetical protein
LSKQSLLPVSFWPWCLLPIINGLVLGTCVFIVQQTLSLQFLNNGYNVYVFLALSSVLLGLLYFLTVNHLPSHIANVKEEARKITKLNIPPDIAQHIVEDENRGEEAYVNWLKENQIVTQQPLARKLKFSFFYALLISLSAALFLYILNNYLAAGFALPVLFLMLVCLKLLYNYIITGATNALIVFGQTVITVLALCLIWFSIWFIKSKS